MGWIKTHQYQLVDRTFLQCVVGRLTLCARFVEFGRYHINFSYAALAGARHLKFQADVATISAEMVTYIENLSSELRLERWEPLVASTKFE